MAAKAQTPQAVFAANVARIREQRGLTQEQLGWAAGIHQTAIARIEKGERKPTLDTIFKLAAGLEVPAAELFAGID
ncbi:MAG TPA: helix-turn-helix transcriptional regulator [Solirubrobacterales bacterium]|nr:helix-turn-helix transcriptional regulator [Solirubrobacterales bacterium]